MKIVKKLKNFCLNLYTKIMALFDDPPVKRKPGRPKGSANKNER